MCLSKILVSVCIIKRYKSASRLNRYKFRTVNAIDFLFSMQNENERNKKLTKFIVEWENGTRVILRIELEMCMNFAQLYFHSG